jgi:hypothetical protein
LKKKISNITVDVTTWNTEWEKLHATYLILLEDIKRQVEKNESLTRVIIELETTIEKYNSTIVGSDSYIKQQLEIFARSTLKNSSVNYISHKKEVIDTQTEIFNLRQKIGRIEAIRFNKSAVHQHFSINSTIESSSYQGSNFFEQSERKAIIDRQNTSLDINNISGVVSSSNIAVSGNRSTYYRNTLV